MYDSALAIVLSEVKLHIKKEHKWCLSWLQLMSVHVLFQSIFYSHAELGEWLTWLFIYCQLGEFVNRWIKDLKGRKNIENIVFEKRVLKNLKLILHPIILIIGKLRALLKHQRLVPMYFFSLLRFFFNLCM